MKLNKKHMFILGTLWKTDHSQPWVENMTHLYVQLKINTYLALDFQFDLILHCRTHSMCGKTMYTEVMYIEYFLQYSSRKFNWIQIAADKTDLPSYKLCIGYLYPNRSNILALLKTPNAGTYTKLPKNCM